MRKMSDLCTVIEYCGAKFIPIVELFKIEIDSNIQDADLKIHFDNEYTTASLSLIGTTLILGYDTQKKYFYRKNIYAKKIVTITVENQFVMFQKLILWNFIKILPSGEELFELMTTNDYTEVELAAHLGIHHATVSKILSGYLYQKSLKKNSKIKK